MGRRMLLLLGAALAGCPGGCATRQTCYDQDKLRCCLVELYTNQVLDNLILAANGLPFIQVDYSNATTTVTVTENASFGGSQQTTNTGLLQVAAVELTRALQTGLTYSVGGSNSNQITLTANPVTNANEVYDAYLEFLTVPGSLVVTCDPPPKGAAHLCKKWHGEWYWVPVEFRTQFLRLALITTAQRGKRLLPLEDYFAVNVVKVVGQEEGDAGLVYLSLKLEGKVPNDAGRVEFALDGKGVRYRVELYAPPGAPRPESTDVIRMVFDPKVSADLNTPEAFAAKLPLAGKLYLRTARPQVPSTDDLLQAVRFQLEQIRLNQLRPVP